MPFFSFIVPSHNRAHLIGKTLQSLLAQTFRDFEILVVDDGSTDTTKQVVKALADHRIQYYYREKAGVSAARNFGVSQSKGTFLNFFDSDDLAYPDHLEEAHEFIRQQPEAKFIFFDYEWGDADRKQVHQIKLKFSNPNRAMLHANFASTNSVVMHRSVFNTLKFNEALRISEDWEFWLKNSVRHQFYLAHKNTTYYIDHGERSVRNFNALDLIEQKNLFVEFLKNDNLFFEKNHACLAKINAHMFSYIALHASVIKAKRLPLKLFLKSIYLQPASLFSKRSLAIIKHLMFTW